MSKAAKSVIPPHTQESIYEIIDSCSLNIDEEFEYKEFIEDLGVEYLCTPFSTKAAHLLGEMQVNAFKIGSVNVITSRYLMLQLNIKNQ